MDRIAQHLEGNWAQQSPDARSIEKELRALTEEIRSLQQRLPEEADRVLGAIELLSAELARAKPKKSMLQTAWEATRRAVGEIGEVAPTVVAAVEKLGPLIARLPI